MSRSSTLNVIYNRPEIVIMPTWGLVQRSAFFCMVIG